MADTVSTITLYDNPKRFAVKLMSRSDGTGESNVVKIDKSAMTGLDGTEPSHFMIDKINYDVAGMEVQLSVDGTTDIVLARLTGVGTLDFTSVGGLSTYVVGATGDILLSTNLHAAGDNYDITIYGRKKN